MTNNIRIAPISGLRRWTYEDIMGEVKDVINQMIEKFGKGEDEDER